MNKKYRLSAKEKPFTNKRIYLQALNIYNSEKMLVKKLSPATALSASSLTDVQSGIYFVQLSGESERITIKIIKN